MLYPDRQLFCYRLHKTPEGLVKEGVSPRYTIMTLLGLHRAQLAGFESPVDCDLIFDGLTRNLDWIDHAGDLGLLLWLGALQCPHRLGELIARADLGHVLSRYPDVEERRTMELAWVLAGLSHLKLAGAAVSDQWSRLAERTFGLLKANQGKSGAFGHLAPGWAGAGPLRGHIGSFADQVYPIYACSKYAAAYGSDEALRAARDCAEVICREQGVLGQWWWHYEARSGRAVGKYPVYSVHQDGMAPLALFALVEAAGLDLDEPIYRGLRWIWGDNELGVNLCDDQDAVIWRCVRPARYRKYSSECWPCSTFQRRWGPCTSCMNPVLTTWAGFFMRLLDVAMLGRPTVPTGSAEDSGLAIISGRLGLLPLWLLQTATPRIEARTG